MTHCAKGLARKHMALGMRMCRWLEYPICRHQTHTHQGFPSQCCPVACMGGSHAVCPLGSLRLQATCLIHAEYEHHPALPASASLDTLHASLQKQNAGDALALKDVCKPSIISGKV